MVSVIIPTYKAGISINKLLTSLKRQTVNTELIVIDSSSPDDTVDIAASSGAHVLVIKQQEFNHGGTRNLGALHSHGDIIIFMTQDALPLDQFCIENLIKPLEVDSIAAVYGRQIPREEASH